MWTAEGCEVGEDELWGMSWDGRGGKESGLRDMGVCAQPGGLMMSGKLKREH